MTVRTTQVLCIAAVSMMWAFILSIIPPVWPGTGTTGPSRK
jgi:hypothetical protein